ncbi:arginase family protein [Candidatus Woesearchaeota archaeon]|jgi:agmatinase|nr:arginase family protein [Candidatus Woesearchaeota archaeon]MBT7368862.1 arginase family protein [Candidatus Woesearchaeota archaeon]
MTKIIKIPFSKGGLGKTEGCELGPDKIVSVLKGLGLNEKGYKAQFSFDLVDVDQNDIELTNSNIFSKVLDVVVSGGKNILLGGDHSITYSAFKAVAAKNPGCGLVIFDAHPDCENDFNPPTHEDFLKVLVNEGIVDPSRVILVGVRSWDGKEKEFLDSMKIRYFSMKQIKLTGVSEVCDTVTETIRGWNSVYVSIDIDCVDPAHAPGTGYCEPGGLSSRDLIYFLQRLRLLRNIKMIDLVEINPEKDVNGMTVVLGAKIVNEMG